MRVAINHETIYRYHEPAKHSVQYLRLTPISGLSQRVLSWKVNAPGSLRPWTDGFGNAAHVLVMEEPHSEIRIQAVGEVEIADGGRPLLGDGELHSPELYLRPSRLTEPDERLRNFVQGFRPGFSGGPRKGLEHLVRGIQDAILYRPGMRQKPVTVRQTLDEGAGHSQDQAQLFISCCRSLGVPARYVSGYLCSDDVKAGGIASHAWAEAWLDGTGWHRYDIANPMTNAQAHVRIAIGLDALDATPVRAMRQGGNSDQLDIEVSIGDARLIKQQQQQ